MSVGPSCTSGPLGCTSPTIDQLARPELDSCQHGTLSNVQLQLNCVSCCPGFATASYSIAHNGPLPIMPPFQLAVMFCQACPLGEY